MVHTRDIMMDDVEGALLVWFRYRYKMSYFYLIVSAKTNRLD